jgi:hypothetical protein
MQQCEQCAELSKELAAAVSFSAQLAESNTQKEHEMQELVRSCDASIQAANDSREKAVAHATARRREAEDERDEALAERDAALAQATAAEDAKVAAFRVRDQAVSSAQHEAAAAAAVAEAAVSERDAAIAETHRERSHREAVEAARASAQTENHAALAAAAQSQEALRVQLLHEMDQLRDTKETEVSRLAAQVNDLTRWVCLLLGASRVDLADRASAQSPDQLPELAVELMGPHEPDPRFLRARLRHLPAETDADDDSDGEPGAGGRRITRPARGAKLTARAQSQMSESTLHLPSDGFKLHIPRLPAELREYARTQLDAGNKRRFPEGFEVPEAQAPFLVMQLLQMLHYVAPPAPESEDESYTS